MCVCVCVCVCIYIYIICGCIYKYIYHNVFLHLYINGRLSGFHILTIVNNAAMDMECMYLVVLVFLFSSDEYPEVGLPDNMEIPFFFLSIFEETLYCFP